LAVNENPNADDGQVNDNAPRRINAPSVKRPGRTKLAKKPQPRRGRNKVSSSESESDNEVENKPPRRSKGGRKERIIESDSDEELQMHKPASRPRSGRATKVVQEPTSSGKKRLSENNSF
jgi:DTHCT (NUC029) region